MNRDSVKLLTNSHSKNMTNKKGHNTLSNWFHITPLFLLPEIADKGGLRCGADTEADGLPRRDSSKEFDDRELAGLNNKRVADFVLLYRMRTPMNNLLLHKISGRRTAGQWRSYPHVVLIFDAESCLKLAGSTVFGSATNIGRALAKNQEPTFTRHEDQSSMELGDIEEILISADSLPNRMLPLSAMSSIETFSVEDKNLIDIFFQWSKHGPMQVAISDAEQRVANYTHGQSLPPGADYLRTHRDLFDTIQRGDKANRKQLIARLACECFD